MVRIFRIEHASTGKGRFKMIYITGDCHSNFERFNPRNFPEQKEMTKDDYVIDRISWPGKKEKPFVFESWENRDYSKVVHAIKKYI